VPRELRTSYTVAELAKLMGFGKEKTRRMLLAAGVPLRPAGAAANSPQMVWLSDLRTHMHHAWLSIKERMEIQALEK
jgi:hypothetical protein